MDHELVIEHRDGCYAARCGCGGWRQSPVPVRVGRLREVYSRLEDGHRRHVECTGQPDGPSPAVALSPFAAK